MAEKLGISVRQLYRIIMDPDNAEAIEKLDTIDENGLKNLIEAFLRDRDDLVIGERTVSGFLLGLGYQVSRKRVRDFLRTRNEELGIDRSPRRLKRRQTK